MNDLTLARKEIQSAFSIDDERTFDQDPRFGLAVMAEIGCRAMSAAINDSGTAIDVIGRCVRLLASWTPVSQSTQEKDHAENIAYPRVSVPPLTVDDLFDDVFLTMARDGAGRLEVQIRLQKGLLALSRLGDACFKESAIRHSKLALERAKQALTLESEKQTLRELAAQIDS